MSKFHKTASKHFPQLLSNLLKKHAFIAWVSQYPELTIKCIALYKYSSKPKKYAVVIEVSDIDQTVRLTDIECRRPLITEDLSKVYKEGLGQNFKNEWIFFVKLPGKESHCFIANPQKSEALISIIVDKKNETFNEGNFDLVGIHEPHLILHHHKHSYISEAKEAFDKAVKEGEIEEELENLELMEPRTITEWDIRNKGIEKLKINLKHYKNYFRPKKAPEAKKKLRPDQEDKLECQKIAKEVWKEHLLDIKYMIMHPDIKKIVGRQYKDKTVHRWLSKEAPDEVQRKGTRSKNYVKEQLAICEKLKIEVPKK